MSSSLDDVWLKHRGLFLEHKYHLHEGNVRRLKHPDVGHDPAANGTPFCPSCGPCALNANKVLGRLAQPVLAAILLRNDFF
jgi:hypothetical protein